MAEHAYWYAIDAIVTFPIAVILGFLFRSKGEKFDWQRVMIIWAVIGVFGVVVLYAHGTLHDVDTFAAPLTP